MHGSDETQANPIVIPLWTQERLQGKIKDLEGEIQYLRHELMKERENNERLKATQGVEMEGLKVFLDTHDNSEASDVVSQLADINSLVDEFASQLALDWITPASKGIPQDVRDLDRAKDRVGSAISPALVSALDACHPKSEVTHGLLQHTFQAIVIHAIHKMFRGKFYHVYSTRESVNQVLGEMAKSIQKHEIQPVYGRWRSIAHRHTRLLADAEVKASSSEAFSHNAALYLMRAGGILNGSLMSDDDYDRFASNIAAPIQEIENRATKLSNTIKEEVITKDYKIRAPSHGHFDPNQMELPFGAKPSAGDQVLFPVTLGMISRAKPGRERVPVEQKVVLKPIVVTESFLQDLLQPAQEQQRKREAHVTQERHPNKALTSQVTEPTAPSTPPKDVSTLEPRSESLADPAVNDGHKHADSKMDVDSQH